MATDKKISEFEVAADLVDAILAGFVDNGVGVDRIYGRLDWIPASI